MRDAPRLYTVIKIIEGVMDFATIFFVGGMGAVTVLLPTLLIGLAIYTGDLGPKHRSDR
jgi:hypothetical protein